MVSAHDLLVRNIGQLVTCAGERPPRDGDPGVVPRAALLIRAGRIAAVGPEAEVLAKAGRRVRIVDAKARPVVPGFVDCHTHLVFAGWRASEFEMRLAGRSYLEIAASGGGIATTVRATRAASETALFASARQRLRQIVQHGTTTVEVKSGYGLDVETELKLLRVVRRLSQAGSARVVATFLGAHAVPEEWKHDPDGYVDVVCRTMIPAIARGRLARFCDVFCDRGAFTPAQARRILSAGTRAGLRPKMHADQLTDVGGAAQAARLRCVSADHLVHATPAGVRALARAGTAAVLLPTSTFFLRMDRKAPVAAIREAGGVFALGSDFNPGSSTALSMQTAMRFGCLHYGLAPGEALWAATRGAARALSMEREVGSLAPGRRADFAVLDAPDWRHLVYELDRNVVAETWIGGRRA